MRGEARNGHSCQTASFTRYTYDRPVELGPQVVRLRPAPHCRTRVPSYSLKITPANHFINWQQDPHGNWLARLVFPEQARRVLRSGRSHRRDGGLSIRSISSSSPMPRRCRSATPTTLAKDLAAYRRSSSRPARCCEAYLDGLPQGELAHGRFPRRRSTPACSEEIRYVVRMEPGVQTPDETLTLGSGSCRDFAWLLVQMLRQSRPRRALRLRLSDPAEGRRRADRRAARAPTTTSPTCTPGPRSIFPAPAGSASTPPPACSAARAICRWPPRRITRSAAPDHGRGRAGADANSTSRCASSACDEAPRVTAPFSDDAWGALDALGEQVDDDLKAQDVRLTMGGEPTFVSIDDIEARGMEHRRRRPDQARCSPTS